MRAAPQENLIAPTGTEHYRADIDGLRAVAVLAVIAYHAFPAALPGGFVGVDVFFVISGFIIVHAAAPRAAGTHGRRRFLAHRIARVVPLYWLVTALYLAVGLAAPAALSGAGGPLDAGSVVGIFTATDPFPVRVDLDALV